MIDVIATAIAIAVVALIGVILYALTSTPQIIYYGALMVGFAGITMCVSVIGMFVYMVTKQFLSNRYGR